jgi:MoaA/NifB/PqqE/SkfB family radical SAM enzyme
MQHSLRPMLPGRVWNTLETFDQILIKFKQLGKACGEHVRKDFNDIIWLAVRRRFRVRLVTNAVNVTEPMARSLKKAGLRIAQVSLDGACEATYERVRGKGQIRPKRHLLTRVAR